MTVLARRIGDSVVRLHRLLLRILYESPVFRWSGKPIAKAVYAWSLPGSKILLPGNPLFSPKFYAASNPDVGTDRNLWAHYIGFGADERRNPHPMFATSFYLARNPDVVSSGLNPLIHYCAHGAAENRCPYPGFSAALYLMERPDACQSGMNPLLHYWEHVKDEETIYPARSRAVARATAPGPSGAADPQQNSLLFSILVPTFNTPPKFLRLAVDSVLRQKYPRWELCVYDDGSSNKETLSVLKEYAALGDRRIVVKYGDVNLGIARASNAVLALARGEYVCFLDHDDELHPEALLEIARRLKDDPSLDVVYTDQDTVDAEGNQTGTLLKPDWSPELFRGVMFVGHLLVVRSELIRQAGAFDPTFDRIQDFELMLRLSEMTEKIGHVRRILYHWRAIPGSVARGANAKGALEPLQAAAVNAHLSRRRVKAFASPNPSLSHRLTLRASERSTFPRVVVSIRDAGLASAATTVKSILDRSTYPNLVVCVPPPLWCAMPPDRRMIIRSLDETHACLAYDDFLVWIGEDLEVISSDWIETLLLYSEQRDIACVSPLIVCEEKVWCAGLVLGVNQGVGYAMRGLPPDSDGYAGSLSCSREVSAVSGECMMISASMFRQLGGNIKYYSGCVLDGADLALRASNIKMRNIVTPRAIVRKSRPLATPTGWKLDKELFADRWRDWIRLGDPYYRSDSVLSTPGDAVWVTQAGAGS